MAFKLKRASAMLSKLRHVLDKKKQLGHSTTQYLSPIYSMFHAKH